MGIHCISNSITDPIPYLHLVAEPTAAPISKYFTVHTRVYRGVTMYQQLSLWQFPFQSTTTPGDGNGSHSGKRFVRYVTLGWEYNSEAKHRFSDFGLIE